MSAFLKEFLLEEGKRLNAAISVAAFGKHPAWKDFMEPVGLDTQSLIIARDTLYEKGIRGQIESGAWTKLAPEEQVPAFGHLFVWLRSRNFILGRMWASSDKANPPRKGYPMIVCAHCTGLPLDWAGTNLLPQLEEISDVCKIRTPDEVDATIKRVWRDESFANDLAL